MPESQHSEWKESWRDDYWRWICGFANAEGGVLVVGVNDRGEAVGLRDARRLLEELPNKARDLLGMVVEVNLHEKDGKEILEIVTPVYLHLLHDAHEKTPSSAPHVTPEVERLLTVLTEEMDHAEIMRALGLKDRMHFSARYLQAAIAQNLIETRHP